MKNLRPFILFTLLIATNACYLQATTTSTKYSDNEIFNTIRNFLSTNTPNLKEFLKENIETLKKTSLSHKDPKKNDTIHLYAFLREIEKKINKKTTIENLELSTFKGFMKLRDNIICKYLAESNITILIQAINHITKPKSTLRPTTQDTNLTSIAGSSLISTKVLQPKIEGHDNNNSDNSPDVPTKGESKNEDSISLSDDNNTVQPQVQQDNTTYNESNEESIDLLGGGTNVPDLPTKGKSKNEDSISLSDNNNVQPQVEQDNTTYDESNEESIGLLAGGTNVPGLPTKGENENNSEVSDSDDDLFDKNDDSNNVPPTLSPSPRPIAPEEGEVYDSDNEVQSTHTNESLNSNDETKDNVNSILIRKNEITEPPSTSSVIPGIHEIAHIDTGFSSDDNSLDKSFIVHFGLGNDIVEPITFATSQFQSKKIPFSIIQAFFKAKKMKNEVNDYELVLKHNEAVYCTTTITSIDHNEDWHIVKKEIVDDISEPWTDFEKRYNDYVENNKSGMAPIYDEPTVSPRTKGDLLTEHHGTNENLDWSDDDNDINDMDNSSSSQEDNLEGFVTVHFQSNREELTEKIDLKFFTTTDRSSFLIQGFFATKNIHKAFNNYALVGEDYVNAVFEIKNMDQTEDNEHYYIIKKDRVNEWENKSWASFEQYWNDQKQDNEDNTSAIIPIDLSDEDEKIDYIPHNTHQAPSHDDITLNTFTVHFEGKNHVFLISTFKSKKIPSSIIRMFFELKNIEDKDAADYGLVYNLDDGVYYTEEVSSIRNGEHWYIVPESMCIQDEPWTEQVKPYLDGFNSNRLEESILHSEHQFDDHINIDDHGRINPMFDASSGGGSKIDRQSAMLDLNDDNDESNGDVIVNIHRDEASGAIIDDYHIEGDHAPDHNLLHRHKSSLFTASLLFISTFYMLRKIKSSKCQTLPTQAQEENTIDLVVSCTSE